MSTLISRSFKDEAVGQLVAERPARSVLFERYGIDYCCGGKKSLAEACERKGLPLDSIIREIEALDSKTPAPEADWTTARMSLLADHIERTHHDYLREALPRLEALTAK